MKTDDLNEYIFAWLVKQQAINCRDSDYYKLRDSGASEEEADRQTSSIDSYIPQAVKRLDELREKALEALDELKKASLEQNRDRPAEPA